jgi:hypothetical protein
MAMQKEGSGGAEQMLKIGPLRLDWPIHPILFALFPVLSLLASNLDYVAVGEATRALVAVCLLAAALTLGARLFLHDWRKAALIATPAVALLLSYGHLYAGLKLVLGALIIRHRYLAPLLAALTVGWALMVKRRLRSAGPLTAALNLVGAVALAFPLMTLGRATITRGSSASEAEQVQAPTAAELAQGPEGRDIYYIIVDGYGRQDILLDIYGHDNGSFLAALRARRFQIGDQSASNYIQTALSLGSSLNMDYLDVLLEERSQSMSNSALIDLIWHSRVRRWLAAQGYAMVAFRTAFPYTSVTDADLFWFPEGQADEEERSSAAARASAFEVLLFEYSLGRMVLDFSPSARTAMELYLYEPLYAEHRARVLFTLDSLAAVAELPGRHFVFAHVVSPHPPFVFDAQGSPLTPKVPFSFSDGSHFLRDAAGTREDYINGYRDQLRYLNGLLLAAIDKILAASDRPPIIVIQGDHGPGAYLRWDAVMESNLEERSGILNAFLLPGAPSDVVYPTISPVNAYRMVLSLYFGADLPPLPDCTYFSSTSAPDRLEQAWDCIPPGPDWPEAALSP